MVTERGHDGGEKARRLFFEEEWYLFILWEKYYNNIFLMMLEIDISAQVPYRGLSI